MAEALNPNEPNEESLFTKAVKNVELVAKLVSDTVGIGEEKTEEKEEPNTENEATKGTLNGQIEESVDEEKKVEQDQQPDSEGSHPESGADGRPADQAGSEDEVDDAIDARGEGSDAGRPVEPSQNEVIGNGQDEPAEQATDIPLPASDEPEQLDESAAEQVSESEEQQREVENMAEQGINESVPDDEGQDGSADPADTGGDHAIDTESLYASSTLARAPTPSSRTSTPPLGPGSTVPVAKKFSSINVNKKFLSKTASPVPGTPSGSTSKVPGLNGRTTASPVPISSASSRFLSSKISTIPSKSSTSPNPPAATPSSAGSSPWAVPVIPAPSDPGSIGPSGAAQGGFAAQSKPRMVTTTTMTMGSGHGIGGSASRNVWRAVQPEGRKAGLSRDFPTAKEVAEGKNQAVLAAQAQAAHNQAIIQGLNAFTHLDPNAHRWDDEEDDDGVIDFGDGTIYPPHDHAAPHPNSTAESHLDDPVSKGERFMDDFDRSWPRKAPVPVEGAQRRTDGDRVLFNASLNRLEPSSQKPAPPPVQPTRLMTRPESKDVPPHMATTRQFDRAPPPHLQAPESGRQLPPHLPAAPSSQPQHPAAISSRPAWGARIEPDRQLPPHIHERRELPPQSSVFEAARSPPQSMMNLPRRASNQMTAPPPQQRRPSHSSSQAASQVGLPAPSGSVDDQTAEMHTAAEKARLRRLAEEQEREAAAERARQKAKELEARLGLKGTSTSASPAETTSQPAAAATRSPPGVTQSAPQPTFTIAQRPKPPPSAELPAALPSRQPPDARPSESSWRSKTAQSEPTGSAKHTPVEATAASAPQHPRSARPAAESFFEAPAGAVSPTAKLPPAPPSPAKVDVAPSQFVIPVKPESTFDSMLARIQAAMKENRATPPPSAPGEPIKTTTEESGNPTTQSTSTPDATAESSAGPSRPSTKSSLAAPSMAEFFDVTQIEIPRSPPPVWRTYAVKFPKDVSTAKPAIPDSQLRKSERSTKLSRAWIMTFEPPIDGLDPKTLSRADFLLPQPVVKRFSRADTSPVVSISPRKLEPFERKPKKKLIYDGPSEVAPPSVSAESLLPSSSNTASASATLMAQRTITSSGRWKGVDPLPASSSGQSISTGPTEVQRKSKSPVKASPAARAEKDGLFSSDGVLGATERGRLADTKPGVRFMVSSELEGDVARFEGDILLDEVNKMSLMSLEGVEEGGKEEIVPRTPGAETPKTPPSVSGTSSRGQPSSPNGTTTPWTSKTGARSSSQHDSIRSVWEPPNESTFQNASAAPSFSVTSTPIIQGDSSSTPMYPSLNAPSSSSDLTSQPMSTKMSYSHSQPFSSPGTSATSFGMRPSPHYGYTAADQQSMMGLNYASLGARANGMPSSSSSPGWAGASMGQQGVWSPSAFGTSMASPAYVYGTSKNDTTKAALAFSTSGAKEGMPYASSAPYPGYAPQQGYNQQQQAYAGRSPGSAQRYGYGYGAPGQGVAGGGGGGGNPRPAGRFAQASGAAMEYAANGSGGGVHQQQQQQQQQHGGYYGSSQQQQPQQLPSQQQQASQGGGGGGGGSGGGMYAGFNVRGTTSSRGGKMW
ncbi:hypothetical protein BCR39DRAFT_588449 [Naematelia encephala]|uniref:Uncharacterized protein n=1 Tax=Naematelia encephala TaxID=71784 RepID=A0A1Y2B2V9_9TREE|nr:hypothetical protein BCR39DRAFT_588449 [Naematelia encephala]